MDFNVDQLDVDQNRLPQILSPEDVRSFRDRGFIVLNSYVALPIIHQMRQKIMGYFDPLIGPIEFEADVGYPGAPESRNDVGGATPRRLLRADARDQLFGDWAKCSSLGNMLKSLMDFRNVMLSLSHHNCIMTKYPGFSSATHWHQDIRYWSYDRAELISVWLALGTEETRNGSLWVIPGSHRLNLASRQFDENLFLRQDLPDNAQLIRNANPIHLEAGDLLCFHCRLFHAAGQNKSDETKYSVVFTYHDATNLSDAGTKSSTYPSIPVI